MNNVKDIELFCLKAAILEGVAASVNSEFDVDNVSSYEKRYLNGLDLEQFDLKLRQDAAYMSEHYRIFYMLENEIRRIISETLENAHGPDWWSKVVPDPVKKEVEENIKREEKAAISKRSNSNIDYSTFGQLGDIIRANWSDFAGMLSNQNALGRVLFQLNLSRGPIAHCGLLEPDEVERLYLSIKDWFRVAAGPSSR